jgi:sorting nexin-25
LPPASKSIFARTTNSKTVLEKARSVTQKYVDAILADEHLSQSEPVYSFLSPSPACLKSAGTAAISPPHHVAKSFGPFSGVFGGDNSNKEDDDELWLDEFDATTVREGSAGNSVDQSRDAEATDIAESLYALIGEIFDMRGVFRWIRKSLMTFAQITYGSSINRQIRDTVAWLTSEQMILHYLQATKALVASSGGGGAAREELNSSDLRAETRAALLQNVPEELVSLVGQQAAANGAAKVFEVLQSVTLNKQLVYSVLELVVSEVFPELSVSPHVQMHHHAHPPASQ